MENKEIHKKLDRKELRDFLGIQLNKARNESFGTVDSLEKDFKRIQEQLKYARIKEAIELILMELNWNEFDISEYINYSCKEYFPFIGTKEEYKETIKNE